MSAILMHSSYITHNDRDREGSYIGHDRFNRVSETPRLKIKRQRNRTRLRRAHSVPELDAQELSATHLRNYLKNRSTSIDKDQYDNEQKEKWRARLESFAKFLFNRSGNINSTDYNRSGSFDQNLRVHTNRKQSQSICQEWIKTTEYRFEIIAHLDDIGCQNNKNWFLLNDKTVRTDRLMSLVPIPLDCVALEEMSPLECPKTVLMELLASLQHPYIYPVLDLGFFYANQTHYVCPIMPLNSRGSLKDLIFKSQWHQSWNRKYSRKSTCVPISQIQRFGRQILEALLFLRERGFASHGHIHSGNIIVQNGVARVSGLENGLLGLNSHVNAVIWSRNVIKLEYMDIICFAHLLFEMCTGKELKIPLPSTNHIRLHLGQYPQVVEVLQLIFDPPEDRLPSLDDLVLCDAFRNIELRELRAPSVLDISGRLLFINDKTFQSIKPELSASTLKLLNAVRQRQIAKLSGSYSGSASTSTPSTPRDPPTGSHFINFFGSDSASDISDITSSSFIFSKNNLPNASTSTINSTEDKEIDAMSVHSFSSDSSSVPHSSKHSKRNLFKYSMQFGSSRSQDSAFGSMKDDELSNSIRMNSLQSIAMSTDDGIGDSITSLFESPLPTRKAIQLDEFKVDSKTNVTSRQSSNCPMSGLACEHRILPNKAEKFEFNVNRVNSSFSNSCVITEKSQK